MLESDFEIVGVTNFTPKEVRDTGADLDDVQIWTMRTIQRFRDKINEAVGHKVSVSLLKNGMTTGNHKSPYHPSGEAIDCYLSVEVTTTIAFKCALDAGFKGIGIYWNGKAYSYHLDTGDDFRFWIGIKKPGEKKWTFDALIVDPKHLGG